MSEQELASDGNTSPYSGLYQRPGIKAMRSYQRKFNLPAELEPIKHRLGSIVERLRLRLRSTTEHRKMVLVNSERPKRPFIGNIDEAHSCPVKEDFPIISLVYRLGHPYQLSTCPMEMRGNSLLGPTKIIVYEAQLMAGLRFPLLPFFVEVLLEFQLSPSQIHPNGWRLLVALYRFCRRNGARLTGAVFRRLYKPLVPARASHVVFRPIGAGLDIPLETKITEWRSDFFVLSDPKGFSFPTKWNRNPSDVEGWLVARDLTPMEENLLVQLSGDFAQVAIDTSVAVDEFLNSSCYITSEWRMAQYEGFDGGEFESWMHRHGVSREEISKVEGVSVSIVKIEGEI